MKRLSARSILQHCPHGFIGQVKCCLSQLNAHHGTFLAHLKKHTTGSRSHSALTAKQEIG
jgi:hypothetical protein